MRTRTKLVGMVLPVALLLGGVAPVLADTTGGGNADLGLDAVNVTAASVNSRTGIATVSGTISCSQDLTGVFVSAEIDQVVGRFHTLRGWGGTVVDCSAADGTAGWTMTIQPDQGKYANGRATINAAADVSFCDDVDCYDDSAFFGPADIHLGH
jgi:hypothetical protein